MAQTNELDKHLLDPKVVALIEADFLDSKLQMTSKAITQLNILAFKANQATLVAMAIAENKLKPKEE